MRLCVIRNKDLSISCLPVNKDKSCYYSKYDVVCFIKKSWNIYHIKIIKKYFEKHI